MDEQIRDAREAMESAIALLRVAMADPIGESGALYLAFDMTAKAAMAVAALDRWEAATVAGGAR